MVFHRPAPKVDRRFKAAGSPDLWVNGGYWINVKSSNVAAVMYDKPKRMLWVRFKGGSTYSYYNVSPVRARKFFLTGSFGHEVWELRWAGYRAARVIMGKTGRRRYYRARR